MDFSNCFNCGQQGHFASSCPVLGDTMKTPVHAANRLGNHPPQWKRVPLRSVTEQDAINARGLAQCRAALAKESP